MVYKSCFGSFCDGSGRDGKRLLFWLPREPWSSDIALVFVCIGNGFPEPGTAVAESGGQGDSGADLSHGGGEPDLGSTPYSRRAAEAGSPGIGAHGLPLAATSAEEPEGGQALGDVSANHREAIAAMDFFMVPTITFGVLYCFFVIGHDRRKILHCNVTRNPHALWIVQQMREAWPYAPAKRFLLFDHDAKFGTDVVSAVRTMGSHRRNQESRRNLDLTMLGKTFALPRKVLRNHSGAGAHGRDDVRPLRQGRTRKGVTQGMGRKGGLGLSFRAGSSESWFNFGNKIVVLDRMDRKPKFWPRKKWLQAYDTMVVARLFPGSSTVEHSAVNKPQNR